MNRLVMLLAFSGVLACAVTEPETIVVGSEGPPVAPVPDEDRVAVDPIKGDSATFDRHNLMDDATFTDTAFMSVADVQAFFEQSPYKRRSFLADQKVAGVPLSKALVDAAKRHGINPLVLLVKLQVETGLVSLETAPKQKLIDRALGCGCPDNKPCAASEKGLGAQLECAGDVFQGYLEDLAAGRDTIAGWRVGEAKKTLDPLSVTPKNRATAALYTYTPWVLTGEGGNWLFWNVAKKYQRHLLASKPNHRWVGGPCVTASDCAFAEAQCLTIGGRGQCTRTCSLYCPDSTAAYTSGTFCTDLGTAIGSAPQGYCLARCDESLFSKNDGCAAGSSCVEAPRMNAAETTAMVCWPGG